MPPPGHHPPHSEDDDDNPTHLPIDPDQGPFADELPADGPAEGGTEPHV